MHTVTADENKRVRIPDAQVKQVFVYEKDAQGTIHLTPIVARPRTTTSLEAIVADTWQKLGPAPEIDYDKL